MKTTMFLLLSFLFISCSQVYRYQSIQKTPIPEKPVTFYIDGFDIKNAEILLLDESVISNSITASIGMVMMNNGFSLSGDAPLVLKINVLVENNDIIKNEQYISIIFKFRYKATPIGSFILSSKSKNILLDKSLFIDEFGKLFALLNNEVLR